MKDNRLADYGTGLRNRLRAILAFMRRFLPEPSQISYRENLRGSIGALLGIAITGAISTAWIGAWSELPLLIAPMGASAVLLFGVPASPLAQPWSIMGGNLVAALVGVTAAHWIHAPLAAATIAIAISLGLMSLLRCLHPPSGAVALTAVLGGSHVLASGYWFVLVPVALNSLVLVVIALAYNNATRHPYPHRAHAPLHPHIPTLDLQLVPEDFDAVLADYGEVLDIERDDLEVLFRELLARAKPRG